MITGYNHNVKYKEKMFHVQTEDSGVKNPHIITLLYYGGNILESVKSSYSELLSKPDLEEVLSALMQKQHKEMLRGLVSGRFDTRIDERAKNAAFLNGPAPLNVDAGAQHSSSFGFGGARPQEKPTAPKPQNEAAAASAPATVATPPSASEPSAQTPSTASPASDAPPPVDIAATVIPAAADGSFKTEGSLLDAFAKATSTLDANELIAALDSGNDDYVFGGHTEAKNLDSLMLDFLKGS